MRNDHIPFGLASKIMALVAAVGAVVAAYHAIKEGDHSEETIYGGIMALVSLVTLAGGRYAQAAMKALGEHLAHGETDELDSRFHGVTEGPVPVHDEGDGDVRPVS